MTRAIPFTQAALRRALAAAKKAGMQVVLQPDGSMVFQEAERITITGPDYSQLVQSALEPGEKVVL